MQNINSATAKSRDLLIVAVFQIAAIEYSPVCVCVFVCVHVCVCVCVNMITQKNFKF